ncbi:endonuclease/exonuclease/phosphatase family protein [Oscillatoria sp. FACHB-1407]|uniref:bluetail domain-containing putative surface protein n=1 Tax=Oscillatoria sp. FACHB-1407 TaxID=2692847 RepID=UPI0016829C6F|nr:bluetail domain-containing putative surface protein [Oscillatoria sp. FACHB-1407]MBD2461453.1 endonuclease/exonuclease/phosphatase family protein [Oscillatoria sp. FACHB-1407]
MSAEYHNLAAGAFTQDWSNTGLITTNADWSNVPSIIGYLGDDLSNPAPGVDPQSVVADLTTAPNVNANQTNPILFTAGGVAEFELTDPVVALQASGTADAPFLLIHLNTTGVNSVNVAYTLRDIDNSSDNAVQPVALQYRVGTTGDFINVPAAFVADASTGPSLADQVTQVSAVLPTNAANQPQVQVRIITANANSNDELIGIDNINITGTTGAPTNNNGAGVRIRDIQGAAHVSPFNGQSVSNVPGIVTVLRSNGFYLQDPNPDTNDATSEGIFVFTNSAPTVAVGDSVLVSGTVSEFRPGGSGGTNNLSITQIGSPTVSVVSSNNPLPAAIVLGNGGRTIPNQIISNDASGGTVENPATTFDPAQDGIDFYESLEGMRVQINNPIATSPTNVFGTSEEIWVLADNGANATSRTTRGGSLITASDFNPERIQIDDLNNSLVLPTVNVGAQLSTVTGVVSYDFSNYEVLVSTAPTVVQPSTLQREVTNLAANPNQLTVATFNVENLDPNPADGDDDTSKFTALATRIVNNLRSPDIISLEEVQDNNGATNDAVVDATQTYQTLINAIAAAGGPTYQFRQIDPVDDQDGGQPGGNIRVGFLFNPARVSFVDRPGGTSTTNTTVSNVGGRPQISASPGRLDPTNAAFASSRKPLVGEFVFNGQTVYVIANHFNSKGGDQPLLGRFQPPTLTTETQRRQQATIVRDFAQSILAINPNANIMVVGDLNDFEFSEPLNILRSAGLTPLIETLPPGERYTYNFEGNAQTLDHILVSNNLLRRTNGYDVVHINSEFADQESDHDPSVAGFQLVASQSLRGNNRPNRLNGSEGDDTLSGLGGNDVLSSGAGDDLLNGGIGGDTLTGGDGGDRYIYSGRNQRIAFANSLIARPDRILGFNVAQGDKIVLAIDNNLATTNLPRGLFNTGVERTRTLLDAVRSAFTDKDQRRRGNQRLAANEAVLLTWRRGTYLVANDNRAGFVPGRDLVVNVTGIALNAGDARAGVLAVTNYFG